MIKQLSGIVCILICLFCSCQNNSGPTKPIPLSNKFILTGLVTGFKDSTRIFLRKGKINSSDSTYIIGGKFKFSGKPDTPAEQVVLQTADQENYKFIWLENTHMTVQGTKGSFTYAKITGSKTQFTEDTLDAVTDPLQKRENQLFKLLLSADQKNRLYKTIDSQISVANIHFVEKHPNSIISANLMDVYSSTWGRATVKRLYGHLSPAIKNTHFGKSVAWYISINQDVSTGKKYVDFTQYDTSGSAVKLSQYQGKIILLDFWASWCHPCRMENPNQVKAYNKYKQYGFEIVAVSVDDDKSNWIQAIKHDKLNYINVSEKNGGDNSADKIYGIQEYPTNFLIDRNGIIIAKDLRGKGLNKALAKIFKH